MSRVSEMRDWFGGFKSTAAPLAMSTCYDAPFAAICVEAGIDLLLVGDSVANAMLGHDRTAKIGMSEMLHHTGAVRRGAPTAKIVADMPFGSDLEPALAAANGLRLVEAGADVVKLEGAKIAAIEALVAADVPVMGHLGLLPQTATSLRQVGRTAEEQDEVLSQAVATEKAGICCLLLEHVPSALGAEVSRRASVPTIGIGAGSACDGQVLVLHDLLGLSSGRLPPFVRRFGDVRGESLRALKAYADSVHGRTFPGEADRG